MARTKLAVLPSVQQGSPIGSMQSIGLILLLLILIKEITWLHDARRQMCGDSSLILWSCAYTGRLPKKIWEIRVKRLHWTQHSEIASDPGGQTRKQNCMAGMPYSPHTHICRNSLNMLESFELLWWQGHLQTPVPSWPKLFDPTMHLLEEDCKGWLLKDIGNAGAERSRKNQTSKGPRSLWNVNTSRVFAKCCLMLSIYIYVVPIPPSSMGRLQDVAMHPTWKNVIGSLTTFRQAIQSQGALDTKAQSVSSGYGVSWASTSVAHCTLHFFLFSVHLNVFEPTFVHHQVTMRVKSMWSQMLAALESCLDKFVQKTSQHLRLFSLCPDCIASWMHWNPHEK